MRTPTVTSSLLWPILGAISLHVALFALLFISFVKTPELPPSRPVVKATLYQLESQNQASTQSVQKITGEADKTAAKQFEREQLEQKKRQAQQAAARRKAEQAAAEKQRAAEQKRATEQKAAAKKTAEQRKLELQKAEAAKQRAAEQAKAEAEAKRKQAAEEKRKAEQRAKQKAEAERKKKEAELAAQQAAEKARQAQRKAQEEREAAALADELLQQQAQYQRSLADKQAEQDKARINDLIVQLVSEHWIRPAGARNGMQVTVQVDLLPDGTITHATVTRGSGSQAFDNSAVAAILSVGRIREIQSQDRAVYEQTYRQLTIAFKPEDLGL